VTIKAHRNVISSSTSESEKEIDIKAKRINLRPTRRSTTGNVFLNALNDIDTSETVPLKRKSKIRESYSSNNPSNNDILQAKLNENKEDSSDSLEAFSSNIVGSRSGIFKKKRSNKAKDRNIFQDALTQDSISNSKKLSVLEKESSKNSTHQSIDANKNRIDDQREASIKSSQVLLLNNESDSSDVSTLKNQNVENNIISDNDESEYHSDKIEILDHKRMKSYFLRRARRSVKENVFETALADDEGTSALNASKKQLLNISAKKIKNNVEEGMSERLSNSNSGMKTRLMRSNSRSRSETSQSVDKQAHKVVNDNDFEHDMSEEEDSSTLNKKLSKSSSDKNAGKKARLTRSSRNRYKTSVITNGATKLSTQAVNENVDIEDVDNINMISEIHVNDSLSIERSSTRISSAQINESKAHKNANLSFNMTDKDISMTQEVQEEYFSNSGMSNKTITRQTLSTAMDLNSSKKNNETSHKQKSLNRLSQNYSTPIKAPVKDISNRINKLSSFKEMKTIDNFFKVKQSSATASGPSTSNKNFAPSQALNEKMKQIKMELEKINLKIHDKVAATDKLKVKNANPVSVALEKRAKPTKVVDKAFLVNGKEYKAPRLPRPKFWVTDHLYKFLWKRMEEKYKLATRIKSEKFVQELAKMVSFICKTKNYEKYEMELKALMKEMARLNIIKTRYDFYNFCWDFMPSEFREKVMPMLKPGNKRTIPYDPKTLYTPLLDDNQED